MTDIEPIYVPESAEPVAWIRTVPVTDHAHASHAAAALLASADTSRRCPVDGCTPTPGIPLHIHHGKVTTPIPTTLHDQLPAAFAELRETTAGLSTAALGGADGSICDWEIVTCMECDTPPTLHLGWSYGVGRDHQHRHPKCPCTHPTDRHDTTPGAGCTHPACLCLETPATIRDLPDERPTTQPAPVERTARPERTTWKRRLQGATRAEAKRINARAAATVPRSKRR